VNKLRRVPISLCRQKRGRSATRTSCGTAGGAPDATRRRRRGGAYSTAGAAAGGASRDGSPERAAVRDARAAGAAEDAAGSTAHCVAALMLARVR
jgi:hypothetical protein